MTPQDIAIDMSTVRMPGSVNMSTQFTKTYPGPTTDDANTWD